MNKLVEEIIKPILEANSKIKKVVGIYGGRFQPFGPHHYKTYKWLEKQVDEAYITTSNIKKPPRHPMNFKEKVRHMSKMGVPKNRIIEEKSPYVAKNLAKKFDEETTAFVYVFGKKDAGRLGGSGKYFQDYKKNKNNLSGHEEHGYYLVAPHVSISVSGQEVSGTSMRELLGSSKFDDKERVKLFKKMFGYYDKGIFNMLTNKFKKLFEGVDWVFKPTRMKKLKPKFKDGKGKELLKGQMEENVSSSQLSQVEKYLDKLWGKVGIDVEFTRHFMDRINDKRNDKPINSAEVMRIFKQTYKKYGKQISKLGKDAQAVMKDIKTDVNVPFVLKWDGKEFDLIAKTIMRKKNFKSSNKKFAVEGWLEKGSKKDKALKLKISKLYTKAFKHMPGSPAQEKIKKEIEKLRNQLSEGVDLPIEIGDTVRMGKFKNKKVVVKSIDWNEKGDLLINGRPALKFRIEKKAEVEEGYPNVEDMKKIKKRVNKARSKSESSKEYQYHPIDEFLVHTDITKIIKEASSISGAGGLESVDSGPSLMFKNSKHYEGRGQVEAEKLGWTVINYILKGDTDNLPPDEYELLDGWPIGPHSSVSYLPAGIGTGKTPNNQENLTGTKGYDKWVRAMKSVATEVGFELMKFTKQDRDTRRQIAKDTVDTLNTQKEEEVTESVFSKDWWDEVLTEVSAKTKLFKQKLMRRGIKIRYDKEKAKEDLIKKYGGQGEVVAKKFGLRKAYYAVPKKGFKKDTKPTIKINKKEMEKLHKDKMIDKGNLKVVYSEDWWKDIISKDLLTEGGAYGHMAHPFDDKNLTFGDLKKIIELGLGGQLNREDNVTEKLDGQNIMISWKDGKLIAARNKGHIKNGGKTALDAKGIASKFKGRGAIRNAFVYAMRDLEKAIKSLSNKQKDKIFNNGYNFMNLEVMYPSSANVIDYDVTQLIFHGALKYDDKGNVIGEVSGSGRILAGMIKQRNQNIQKKYSIGKPVFLDVPKHQDFGKMKSKFLGRLQKLQNEFGLKDNDTLGLYHQKWWEQYILKQLKKISPKVLEGLVKRWAFFDKSYKIPQIKQDLKDEPIFLEWVLKTDKENHAKIVKENMKPFEILFFEVGAEILKNVKGFISANPNKSVQGMVKRLDKAISDVRGGGDIKKLNRLKTQLDRLNAIGGTKAIVPSEGLVFKYKGKTYKFTGAFAPVNQIAGLINF
jgi:hypothetical protein